MYSGWSSFLCCFVGCWLSFMMEIEKRKWTCPDLHDSWILVWITELEGKWKFKDNLSKIKNKQRLKRAHFLLQNSRANIAHFQYIEQSLFMQNDVVLAHRINPHSKASVPLIRISIQMDSCCFYFPELFSTLMIFARPQPADVDCVSCWTPWLRDFPPTGNPTIVRLLLIIAAQNRTSLWGFVLEGGRAPFPKLDNLFSTAKMSPLMSHQDLTSRLGERECGPANYSSLFVRKVFANRRRRRPAFCPWQCCQEGGNLMWGNLPNDISSWRRINA